MDDQQDPEKAAPAAETEQPDADPWQRVGQAVRELLDALDILPADRPIIQLPRLQIPRLMINREDPAPVDVPDGRHLDVCVRTVPVNGVAELHVIHDDAGLTWQTYGAEHDFGTDRMLEIQAADGEPVATYPAGTWLDVCYPAYRNPQPVDDGHEQPSHTG